MTSVVAAITALCMAAVATLVGLGPSGIGVRGCGRPARLLDRHRLLDWARGRDRPHPQGLYSLATSGLGPGRFRRR